MTNLATEAQWGTGPKIYVSFDYEYSRDASAMKYRFKITVKALPTSGSGYFGYPIYSTITLNNSDVESGHQLKASTPNQWNSAITYTTGWFTVNNKTSGTTPVSFKIYSGNGSTRSATYTYNLYVSPAVSTVSASTGTLGTAQTLSVTRYSTSYTHTITYTCGSASGTICTKSSSTSVSFTPPLSLASQNTSGTTVSITLTITTYNGNTVVGSSTKTYTANIPSSVKPTLTLTLSDPNGYSSTYGGYVQTKSKLKVQLNVTQAYGSAISTYKVVVAGVTYNTNGCTVDLPTSGTVSISATVTDKRGRSGTATGSITVVAYSAPAVTALSVARCDQNGNIQSDGAYAKITFSARITSLSNNNTAQYKWSYEVKNSGSWTTTTLTELAGQYTVTDATVIFPVDIDKAYQISIQAKDAFSGPWSSYKTVPVAFVLIQTTADGTGLGIGQRATENNKLLIGLDTKFANDHITLDGSLLTLATGLEVITDWDVLPNMPSGVADGGRILRIGDTTGNQFYICIDWTRKLFIGTQLNGAATITWTQL